jgi:hypothetical protein
MIESKEEHVDKLLAFKKSRKFSDQEWEKRGLNPSDTKISDYLELVFNDIADDLVEAVNNNASIKQLTSILKKELKQLRKSDFDTEEKEFICDVFDKLSAYFGINISDDLNKWIYGSVLSTLFKIGKLINPEKIIETIVQPCTKCQVELETHIMQMEQGIPDYSWGVVKCNNCNELNLISTGPNIKRIKFGNYEWVENLSKDEYSFDQAIIRLEQIKFFRKP